MTEFRYPNDGHFAGSFIEDRTKCCGRNGLSHCTSLMITDLSDRLVIRPMTTRGAKANTFIEIPTNKDLLEALAAYINDLAKRCPDQAASATDSLERRYVSAAQKQQVDGELEVDDNARVSHGEDPGAYVQAWLWIPADDIKLNGEEHVTII